MVKIAKPNLGFMGGHALRTVLWLLVVPFILESCTTCSLPVETPTRDEVENIYYAITLSVDGNKLAVSTWSGLYLYQTDTFQEIWSSPHGNRSRRLAFSPDGTMLISIMEGQVTLWNVQSGKALRSFIWNNYPVDLRFSLDGSMLALADGSYDVTVWDAEMDKVISTTHMEVKGFRSGLPDIWSVAWLPDDVTLVAVLVFPDSGLTTWNARTGELLHMSQEYYTCASTLASSPNGERLASGWTEDIAIWDIRTGEQLHQLKETAYVSALAWSPDGTLLFSGASDGTVSIWDAKTGERQRSFKTHSDAILWDGLTFLPDGTTIVSASRSQIIMWDSRTSEQILTLKEP